MKLSKRIVASLIASIVLSAAMLLLERATNSEVLFDLQFPGFYACVLIWGFHSSPGSAAVGHLVFGAVNALAYWPLCFGLSFLFRIGSGKLRGYLNFGRHLRHPEGPRLFQRAEESCADCMCRRSSPDPSLRLRSGCARDDAVKLSHCPTTGSVLTQY